MAEFTFPDESELLFPEKIQTDRLTMVAIARSTIPAREVYSVYSSEGHSTAMEYLPSNSHHSMKDSAEYIKNKKESFTENEAASYFIFESGQMVDEKEGIIGCCGFGIDWEIRTAEVFVWLLPEYQENGFSAERGHAFLELLFEELSVLTVRVKVVDDNIASKKAVEKYVLSNGGEKEGVKRASKMIDDTLCDLSVYSITQSDWQS